MQVLHPEGWPRPRGFSHGVVAEGRVVAIAGQIGVDPATEAMEEASFGGQTRQALLNTMAILREAGAGPESIVEMTWFVTDIAAYKAAGREIGAAWKETLGRHFPAITLVQVSGLLHDQAMIEISSTAVLPLRQTGGE